jgi:predicted metal-dependent HD superfamily phosphohydrolase
LGSDDLTRAWASLPRAEERWRETWALADLPAPPGLLAALLDRYSESHRAYHGVDHVAACLVAAAKVRKCLQSPISVELALWYHDAIYEPRKADNEERSADLATSELRDLLPSLFPTIHEHILATKHQASPVSPDSQYLVDIDLAILGASPEEFDAYELAVRREYRWVPEFLFRSKRREILESFLARPRIYLTESFHGELEEAARINLRRSVAQLS